MSHVEIPREDWPSFIDAFCRQHRGWLGTLRVVATRDLETGRLLADETAQTLAENKPLERLAGTRIEGRWELGVAVGEGPEEVIHLIHEPIRIFRVERTTDHAHRGLRVDDSAGQTTLLSFRASARPEALDGIAPSEA